MNKKTTLASLICVIVALAVYGTVNYANNPVKNQAIIRNNVFNIKIADTSALQAKGLSGVENLKENEGMLFLFNKPAGQYFWMKGMVIPIDIIWIKDGHISGFEERVPTEKGKSDNELTIYGSGVIIDQVLEVASGTVSKLQLQVGDEVRSKIIKK